MPAAITLQRPDPEALLARVQRDEARERRGRLKIFFGAAAGVGKTFAMLEAAREFHGKGGDVVVGLAETHGRAETETLLEGLDRLPPRIVDHRGVRCREFDLDAALRRAPELVLVDELAHSNPPGSRHPKRWQDVKELLDAGIDVWTTLNVQHLESLHESIEGITGIRVLETVPDTVFEHADEVELVDLPPDKLLLRLREGKVYLARNAEQARKHFFRKGNLIALRELSLRRTAERVDAQMRDYRDDHAIQDIWHAGERLLVCVGPTPAAERLVRAAKRLAVSLHAAWIVAYVETPRLQRLSPERRDGILDVLRLAERLGAETVTLTGTHISDEILRYARAHNINRMVMGKPVRKGWRRWFLGSVVDTLIGEARDINFHLLGDAGDAPFVPAKTGTRGGEFGAAGGWNCREILWGVAVPAGLSFAGWPFRFEIRPANLLLLYLLGVFFLAMRFGQRASILASLVSAAAFAFLFAPPIFSFAIAETENLVGLAVMLVVAVVTSNLAQNVRSQARVAAHRERRASALYGLSKELAVARQEEEVVAIGVRHIHEEFGSPCTLIFPSPDGGLRHPAGAPLPISLCGADLGLARWVFNHRQMAGKGTDTLPQEPALYLPLKGAEDTLGVLLMAPADLRQIFLPEQRRLLETFISQIAHALERVRLADRARQATVKMEAEALRNSLLSGISHDLRTPLATIAGASGTLEDEETRLDQESRRKLVRAIRQEAERMSDLTGKLLDMAKLDSGCAALNRQWYPLEEIVGGALRQLEKRLGRRQVNVHLPEGLNLVFVDAVLLQQVLANLLDNAVKYTPEETPVDLRAELSPCLLSLAVADRGPGIPEALEHKVFEKFFRLHAERAQSGVGLGLAICRAIVEAHGGEIRVENREGGGAVFRFTLPMQEPLPRIDPEPAEVRLP